MTEASSGSRIAGLVMIAASLGVVVAMGHHPSGAHGGPLGWVVHGGMIILLSLLTWGFVLFCVDRGAARPLIVAGLLAYAISLFAHIGAATINGFVVPALANPAAPPVSHDLFRMAWYTNQALAQLGVYATGAAYVLWSIDLLRDSSQGAKLAGGLGLLAGVVPAVLLATGVVRLDVAGAFVIYAAHVAWAALIGLLMWRGMLGPLVSDRSAHRNLT